MPFQNREHSAALSVARPTVGNTDTGDATIDALECVWLFKSSAAETVDSTILENASKNAMRRQRNRELLSAQPTLIADKVCTEPDGGWRSGFSANLADQPQKSPLKSATMMGSAQGDKGASHTWQAIETIDSDPHRVHSISANMEHACRLKCRQQTMHQTMTMTSSSSMSSAALPSSKSLEASSGRVRRWDTDVEPWWLSEMQQSSLTFTNLSPPPRQPSALQSQPRNQTSGDRKERKVRLLLPEEAETEKASEDEMEFRITRSTTAGSANTTNTEASVLRSARRRAEFILADSAEFQGDQLPPRRPPRGRSHEPEKRQSVKPAISSSFRNAPSPPTEAYEKKQSKKPATISHSYRNVSFSAPELDDLGDLSPLARPKKKGENLSYPKGSPSAGDLSLLGERRSADKLRSDNSPPERKFTRFLKKMHII